MDYTELAEQLTKKLQALGKARPHKFIMEAQRGEPLVLHYISERGGSVLPGDVSHEMRVSSARIAATLNKLEAKGLITRRIDTSDRRKILVEITREGVDLASKHRRIIIDDTAKILFLLGERDAREYVRLTGKLADIVSGKYPSISCECEDNK